MADSFNVMLALQTPDGLAFGYVGSATRTAMAFTVNSNLVVGAEMAWRMELKGYSETIMGRLTITRAFPPAAAGEWPRYEARVEGIPDEDLALLLVWMEDQDKGGSSRRVEKDPSRFVRDMFAEGMRSASAAQTKLVIDRMNERRARREQMFKKKRAGIGGDFGLSNESGTASSSISGRDARARISAALDKFSRRSAAAEPPAEPAPSPPPADRPLERPASLDAVPEPQPWAGAGGQEGAVAHFTDDIVAAALEAVGLQAGSDSGALPATQKPPEDEPLIDEEPAPPGEPALTVDSAATPPRVQLRYTTASYAEDYQRHLRNSGLFLAGIALGGRGQQVQVELTLPSGAQVSCGAQVVAALPAGTGLMLALTRSDRDLLAAEAG